MPGTLLRSHSFPGTKLLAFSILFVVILWIGVGRGRFNYPDSDSYVAMAQGKMEAAVQPFARRILHPFVVGKVSKLTGLSLLSAFDWVAWISLGVSLVCFSLLAANGRLMAALFLLPWLQNLYMWFTLQDLFYTMLTALFFVALLQDRFYVSLLILILMFVTRESAILLSLALILWAVVHRKPARAVAAAVGTSFSLWLIHHFALASKPNQHGVSELVYTLAKIPYNFAYNCLGLRLMVDTYPHYHNPIHEWTLPNWPILGSIHHLGFFGFDPSGPLHLLAMMGTAFGLAPALFAAGFRWGNLKRSSIAVQVAFGYGLLSFLAMPFLGEAIFRYIGYAWPLFAIAGLAVAKSAYDCLWGWLLPVHFLIAWSGFFLSPTPALGAVAAYSIASQIAVYWWVRRRLRGSLAPAETAVST